MGPLNPSGPQETFSRQSSRGWGPQHGLVCTNSGLQASCPWLSGRTARAGLSLARTSQCLRDRQKGGTAGVMWLLDTGQRSLWAGVHGVSHTHTCTSAPVASSGPFSSPHTGVNHRLPDPAWLFLRSTGRLVWGGRKQPRQLMNLVSWCLRPLLVGQQRLWPAAGAGVCGTESACLPLLPPGISTVGGSSAASGKEGLD